MAYPTDFSNVSATDTITASRNNAITKKIGLTAIDTTDAANPIGHLSIPTLAGTPAGTPANGVGSLVWNSSANSLHVNTTGTTWAEIGGGGSAAFTEAVTITIDDASDVPLTVTQEGAGNILVLENDTREILTVGSDRVVDFNLNTVAARKPSFKFMSSGDSATELKMYGDPWGPATERAIIQVHYNVASYFGIKGYNSKGAQFWFSDQSSSDIFKFGAAPDDATNATLHGADEIFSVPFAAAGAFDLARPTTITANSSASGLTVNQQNVTSDIFTLQNNGTDVFVVDNIDGFCNTTTIYGGARSGVLQTALRVDVNVGGTYARAILDINYTGTHYYGMQFAHEGTPEVRFGVGLGGAGAAEDENAAFFNIVAKIAATGGSGDQQGFRFSNTCNKAGGDYSAWVVDITTAAADNVYLADLRVGATSKFRVNKEGIVRYDGTMSTPTNDDPTTDTPGDWVQVEIGATTYYLPAYT
jgi:hypothetical protein